MLRHGRLIWTADEHSATSSESAGCQIGMGEKSHIIAMNPFSGLSLQDSIFPSPLESSTNRPPVDGQTLDQKINSLEILTTEKGEVIIGNGFAGGTLAVPKTPLKNINGRQSWRRL